MKKIKRTTIPEFLGGKCRHWGRQFRIRKRANPSAKFFWPEIEGVKLNTMLLPYLKAMTENHCSFCDGFPIETVSSETIEHFRPKTRFPHLAYSWLNLFYCCSKCQEAKLENFDYSLLKPDKETYSFEYFFLYDSGNGRIIPNPDRLSDDESAFDAAQLTIETYGLNKFGRPFARQRTVRQFNATTGAVADDFPYRFILTI